MARRFILVGIDGMMPYLTRHFLDRGALPNIRKLVRQGFAALAYPSPPTDTPTNWTTLATGALTGTHGCTSFYVHLPGENFSVSQHARHRTEMAEICQAEFIWQVADRQGLRCVVLNYPGGWGVKLRHGVQIAGWWARSGVPPIRTAGPQRVDVSGGQTDYEIAGLGNRPSPGTIRLKPTDSGIRVSANRRSELIPWQRERWVRLPASPASLDAPQLMLARAQRSPKPTLIIEGVFSAARWTIPDRFAAELLRHVPSFVRSPLSPKQARMGYDMFGDEGQMLDHSRHQARLFADILAYLRRSMDFAIAYSHFHLLDSVNHRYLGAIWPDHPASTPKARRRAWEIYEHAYGIVDQYVGWIVSDVADEDTVVCIVSDHAALPTWKFLRITRALVEAGLLAYRWDAETGKFLVDWQRTRAFPFSEPAYVWVNLKGREPTGVVPERDYEKVRDQIISALSQLRDPETGEPVMQAVLRREEAAVICGLGERIGDVVYFPRPGYGLYDGDFAHLYHDELSPEEMSAPAVRPAQQVHGYHAAYLPGAKVGPYEVAAVVILSGPGIKRVGWSDRPARLVDVAPTAAALLGLPQPANADGRVLSEALE